MPQLLGTAHLELLCPQVRWMLRQHPGRLYTVMHTEARCPAAAETAAGRQVGRLAGRCQVPALATVGWCLCKRPQPVTQLQVYLKPPCPAGRTSCWWCLAQPEQRMSHRWCQETPAACQCVCECRHGVWMWQQTEQPCPNHCRATMTTNKAIAYGTVPIGCTMGPAAAAAAAAVEAVAVG